MAPRFIVGIDLGTTNCAIAAVNADAGEEGPSIEVREVPQLVNPHEVAARALRPSFLYLPSEVDFPAGSLALPWTNGRPGIVGELGTSLWLLFRGTRGAWGAAAARLAP